MFISNSRQFIFVHLYKCAGTSIEVALAPTLRWNDLLLGSTESGERLNHIYLKLCGLGKHSSARIIHDTVGATIWESYFTFATVRNPYAHAVSQFTFSRQHLEIGLRNSQIANFTGLWTGRVDNGNWPWSYPGVQALMALKQLGTSFSEFIRAPHIQSWEGFGALRNQLCDSDGSLLVKRVLRMENLKEEWGGLCTELGIPQSPLGRENASNGTYVDYRGFYRKGDATLVRDRYCDDFELFGYSENLWSS